MAKANLSGKLFGKKIDTNIDKALDMLDKMLICGHLDNNSDMTLINIIKDYKCL